jgi:hypothetical protein
MTTTSNPRNRTMHAFRGLQLCALPMALALLLGPARAQAPEHSTDEAPLELPADAPLDLSMPGPDSGKLKASEGGGHGARTNEAIHVQDICRQAFLRLSSTRL